MKKRNFNDQTWKIGVNIKDSFFAKNNGSIGLNVLKGRLVCVNSGDYEVEVWLDVADFSSEHNSILGGKLKVSNRILDKMSILKRIEYEP